MGYTADGGPPTKSPFTSAYVQWITGIASDVNKLMKYLPALASTQDTYPGGEETAGPYMFVARITGGTLASAYDFEEMDGVTGGVKTGGHQGKATNLLQVGLILDSGGLYVPPGFTPDCFSETFPEGTLNWVVKPIASGTYVHMLASGAVDQVTEYTFSAPLPICVTCG